MLDGLAEEAATRALALLEETGATGSPWMSTQEAAEYLRVKPQRLYDLKARGELVPAGANGSKLLYHRADLDNWARGERENALTTT